MARVTGGEFRGRVLTEPVADGVRPTSDRAREALFSIIGQDLSGMRLLDAFGGTGLLAIEARSRGADVVVVERSRLALKGIRARLAELGISDVVVREGDVIALAPSIGRFDGVLVDPPWDFDPEPILGALGTLASSFLVLEADADRVCPDRAGPLALERTRQYGRTKLWIYRASET